MDLLNMFSDLAPISNSGYRQQLNTDPGILQGIEFIQNENKVKREVAENLDLNLISDLHGTESEIVHSAGILNGQDELGNIEGFKENMDEPATKYYNDLKAQYKIALDKFNALVNSSKMRSLIFGPIVTGIAVRDKSVGRGASSIGLYHHKFCTDNTNNICDADYRLIFSNGVVSNMTIDSRYVGATGPNIIFALSNVPTGGVDAILQGKKIGDNKWYDVNIPTKRITPSDSTVFFDGDTSLFKSTSSEQNIPSMATTLKCDRRNNSYCIFKDYNGDRETCSGPTPGQHYNNRSGIGLGGLPTYDDNQFIGWLDALYDKNAGSDPNRSERVNVVDYVSRCINVDGYEYLKNTKAYQAGPDQNLKKQLDDLSLEMSNISALMSSSVKDNTSKNFLSYNKMQKDIDNIQKRIIEVDGIMKKNATKDIYDVDTSLAKEEETALLSKQRYYVYIIWIVILVIILYITISNVVDPDSSFSVLLIVIVLLILLFLFFMYSKWNTEWYDLKVNLKNLSFSLPDIPKIDFNPLLSVKYTS